MEEPKVIYTDNHLLILNKPHGMATQPDLEEWAKEWMNRPYVHAIHRLDRVASGIVVLAKTSKALSRLQEALREGLFQKTYAALIENPLFEDRGVLQDFLIHDDFRAKVVKEGGKKAVLEYRTIDTKDKITMIEVKLITGRYHQIRIQLSSRGHPILGDAKYGSHYDFVSSGIALHHRFISFPHPISKEIISFEAAFPSSWSFWKGSFS